MTDEKKNEFVKRISEVNENDAAKFGRMNVNQMICHCTDQLRMCFGELKNIHKQIVDIEKLREMSANNQTVPAPDGLDQIAGQGTKPTNLENDKKTLIEYLNKFHKCDEQCKLSFYSYFGELNKTQWERLVEHHLNHHLGQFER